MGYQQPITATGLPHGRNDAFFQSQLAQFVDFARLAEHRRGCFGVALSTYRTECTGRDLVSRGVLGNLLFRKAHSSHQFFSLMFLFAGNGADGADKKQ